MLRSVIKFGVPAMAGLLLAGCIVVPTHSEPVDASVPAPVEVVEVEPEPAARVYIYEPGCPPGWYVYDNYYWYHGHRYSHDYYRNRIVAANLRDHRFMNVEENRRQGRQIEARHREEFPKTHAEQVARQGAGPRQHADPPRKAADPKQPANPALRAADAKQPGAKPAVKAPDPKTAPAKPADPKKKKDKD